MLDCLTFGTWSCGLRVWLASHWRNSQAMGFGRIGSSLRQIDRGNLTAVPQAHVVKKPGLNPAEPWTIDYCPAQEGCRYHHHDENGLSHGRGLLALTQSSINLLSWQSPRTGLSNQDRPK